MKKHHLIRLRHHEIDKAKWDAGIAHSTHPLIHANSWYLDIVAPQWEAIVSPDYSTLWPLTLNRKFSWPVIMQPMFTQQLGLFSSEPVDKEKVAQFYRANKYPVLTLQSHSKMEWPGALHSTTKSNSILLLHKEYPELKKAFSKNCQRNIKKATQNQPECLYHGAPDTFIDFTRRHNNYQLPEKHLRILKQIIVQALDEKSGFLIQVTDNCEAPIAMAFFLRKYKRLTFLSGQSSKEGFRQQSMFLIMNQVIKDHAASGYVLDFEGSDIEGIARFYKSLGAIDEPYLCLQNPLFVHWQKIRKRLSKKNS